jgi:hypothetical protein
LLFYLIERLKERRHLQGVVAGPVHIQSPQFICLTLVLPTVTLEDGAQEQIGAHCQPLRFGCQRYPDEDKLGPYGLLIFLDPVSRRHMAGLMPQDTRELSLVVEIGQEPPIYINIAPRQGKGVEDSGIHHHIVVRKFLAMVDPCYILSYLVDIPLKRRIIISAKLLQNGIAALFPHLYLILIAEEHDLRLVGDRVSGTASSQNKRKDNQEKAQFFCGAHSRVPPFNPMHSLRPFFRRCVPFIILYHTVCDVVQCSFMRS